jgi:hypothetical protein
METVKATLWIYRVALRRSMELLGANWGIIFAPLAYSLILSAAAALVWPLGMIGGFLMTAVTAACASSGLCLIENIVRTGKFDLNDFFKGFTVYIWEILGIGFILWIPMTLLSRVAYSTEEGPLIVMGVRILLYVVLNPVPELIYQTRASGLALLSASYEFIVENWIEWFLPNVLITALGYFLLGWLDLPAAYLPSFFRFFFLFSIFGLLLTFLMIFRGLLFSELHGSTRRSRAYRYRARAE